MTQAILKGMPTTAGDWMLYSNNEGSAEAALEIAQTVSDAIRARLTADIALDRDAKIVARQTAYNVGYNALAKFNDFGALDGESESVLRQVIDRAFDWNPRDNYF